MTFVIHSYSEKKSVAAQRLGSNASATFSSSAAQHIASRLGFHALTESVHFVLRALLGLISSFHCSTFSFNYKIVAFIL